MTEKELIEKMRALYNEHGGKEMKGSEIPFFSDDLTDLVIDYFEKEREE